MHVVLAVRQHDGDLHGGRWRQPRSEVDVSRARTGGLRRLLDPPVVLAYHGISAAARDDGSLLLIDPDHLRSHVTMLQKRGYDFRTAGELVADAELGPPVRTAVLTFDDGWLDGLTTVAPLLEELGVRATFYVNPGRWGEQHPDVAGEPGRLLDADQARALHDRGMELGSHSRDHAVLTGLDDASLADDLAQSKAAVEALTGEPCPTLAYPFGIYDDRVGAAARAAGYELCFGWLPGPWDRYGAPRLPPPTRFGAWALRLKMRGVHKPVKKP
jgi:peptidoglycan/xylan/chitin deacetylase (PgdA/CDA1 family)